jgi:hypothetical protein
VTDQAVTISPASISGPRHQHGPAVQARLSHQFSWPGGATVSLMVTTSVPVSVAGRSLPPARAARSVRPVSAVSTERCAQVVPLAVTTHWVFPGQAVLDEDAPRRAGARRSR